MGHSRCYILQIWVSPRWALDVFQGEAARNEGGFEDEQIHDREWPTRQRTGLAMAASERSSD